MKFLPEIPNILPKLGKKLSSIKKEALSKPEIKKIKDSLEETRKSLAKPIRKAYNFKYKFVVYTLVILASFTLAKLVNFIEIEYRTIMFYRNVKQGKVTKVSPEMLSRILEHMTIAARVYKVINKLKRYTQRVKEWRVSKNGLQKFDEIYLEMESLNEIVSKAK